MPLTPGEVKPPKYEKVYDATINTPAVPLATYRHDVNPSPTAYQGPSATQTWNVPTVAPQWIVTTLVPSNVDSSAPFFQAFLQGKPKALGIVVIVAAIIEIGLGIALAFTAFSITMISGISFWGPLFYIIAGSLTVAAQKQPNVCMVRGSLSLNIISTIFTLVALILNAVDFPSIRYISYRYSYIDSNNYYNGNYNDHNSPGNQQSGYNGGGRITYYMQLYGPLVILSLLFITNVLLFCVTLTTSICGCRSLHEEQPALQLFLVQNDAVTPLNPTAARAYCVQMPPPSYRDNDVKATQTDP